MCSYKLLYIAIRKGFPYLKAVMKIGPRVYGKSLVQEYIAKANNCVTD